MREDEQAEFLNGLLQKAVESRETGDASALWDYLEEWEERGRALAGARARGVDVEGIPWSPVTVPLNEAKFALITTGGVYVEGQEPYQTDGPGRPGGLVMSGDFQGCSTQSIALGSPALRPLRTS